MQRAALQPSDKSSAGGVGLKQRISQDAVRYFVNRQETLNNRHRHFYWLLSDFHFLPTIIKLSTTGLCIAYIPIHRIVNVALMNNCTVGTEGE